MSWTTSSAGVISCDLVPIQPDPEVVVTIVDLDVPVIGYPGMGSILDPDPVLVIDIASLARLRPLQHGPLGDNRFALLVLGDLGPEGTLPSGRQARSLELVD
jgi:hypothetical protein